MRFVELSGVIERKGLGKINKKDNYLYGPSIGFSSLYAL